MRFRKVTRFAILPLAAVLAAVAAFAAVRVGGSAFSVNGELVRSHQYVGACPVDLKFDWGVISTRPAIVSYFITRSDGAGSRNSRSIDLPPNRSVPVLEHWRLGANTPRFANYEGWVELNLEGPTPVVNRIPFTLHCR